MTNLLPSGPEQDPKKSPIETLINFAKENPKIVIGGLIGGTIAALTGQAPLVVSIAGAIGSAIGKHQQDKDKAAKLPEGNPKADDNNKIITIDAGTGQILGSGSRANLPSNDNMEKPGPAERLINFAERNPRFTAAVAGTIVMPVVGTVVGWLGADYAYRKVDALKDRNVEANAKMHENFAAETQNPEKRAREVRKAEQIRQQRKMTF